jgi:putative transposase
LICGLNGHRPHQARQRVHQGIADARPLHGLPVPITDPEQITRLDMRRHRRLGGILHEYQHVTDVYG